MINPVLNFGSQGEPRKPKKVLILPEQAPQLIGRDDKIKELLKVITKLQSSSHLLVNGMGGVGKTAICRVLAHRCATLVNAVIWLDGQAGLEAGLQNTVAPKLAIDIQQPDWLAQLIDKLNENKPPSVLFLDNLEASAANSAILHKLKSLNWHLVATSRDLIEEFALESYWENWRGPDEE